MNTYKAILQYDGSERMGFQWQEGMPTIPLRGRRQRRLTGRWKGLLKRLRPRSARDLDQFGVPGCRVAQSYKKSVMGIETGRIYRVL